MMSNDNGLDRSLQNGMLFKRLAALEAFVEREQRAELSIHPDDLFDGAEEGHFELSRHLTKSGKPEVWWADDDAVSLL